MKFGTKIEFCKIQGTGHPLAKKDEGLKWIFYWNFQSATYVTRFFHFSPFSFNPTISYKKNMHLGSNLVSKSLIVQKHILRPNWKFSKIALL